MASIFSLNNTEPLFISVIEKKQKVDKSKAHASISQLPSTPLGSPENRMAKMKKSLSGFMLNSSANGIPNIIRAKSLFFKLIWTICFVISACTGAYYTVDSIFDYLKYNTVTTFDVIAENQSQFPAITICAYPRLNNSIDETVLKVKFQGAYETNFSQVFEVINDSVYGKCFRYNSGKSLNGLTIDILNVTTTGEPNNLRMNLYLELPKENDFGHILVNIHNHSSPPYDIPNGGYWIRPGSWNSFEIERVFLKKLGEPYNNCFKDIKLFKLNKTIINYILDYNRTYSQNKCYHLCAYLFAIEESNCSCNSTLDRFDKYCIRQFYDIETNITACIAKYLIKFRNELQYEKCNKYCPMECDSISYSIRHYLSNFPASGKIGKTSKKDHGLNRFGTYEEVNQHFVALYVYYKDLKYTLISQDPKTETFNFISNIGGILGLFLGISFLSFVEVFEIFFEIMFILIRIK